MPSCLEPVCDSRGSAHIALGEGWAAALSKQVQGRGRCLGDELDTPGKRSPVLEQSPRCSYVRGDRGMTLSQQAKGPPHK